MSEPIKYHVAPAIGANIEMVANGLELNGATSGGITITPIAAGTGQTTIVNQATAAATITLPAATGTLATLPSAGTTLPGLDTANAFTAANTVTTANATATPSAAQRSITGAINVGTATAITGVTNSPSFAAVRGIATAGSIAGTGQPYVYGTQGKLAVTGTVNNAALWACGVYAQTDFSAGTYTAGQFAGLWVDMGAAANASAKTAATTMVDCIRVTCTPSGFKPKAIFSITANATNFLEFGVADGTPGWYAANTHAVDSHALSYILKVKDPAGNAGYIPVFADVPS